MSLLLFWCVIVFLVVYLRRLLQENTRIRKLYQADETIAVCALRPRHSRQRGPW